MNIEQAANEYADKKYHKSDKTHFTTTEWTQWNIAYDAWTACAKWHEQNQAAQPQLKQLLMDYDLEVKKHLLNYGIEHAVHAKICEGLSDLRNKWLHEIQPKK